MQGSPPVRAVRARTKHEETQLEDQLSGMLKHEGDGSRVGQCRAECKSLLLLLLLSRFSRVRLCDPIDSSPPGSPIPGILQARTLGCHFLLQCMKMKREREVVQSCLTLSDPMDCSLPGSSIHGILQSRVLEPSHC